MIYRIRPPSASLCLWAQGPGQVQQFPMLLAAMSLRVSGHTVTSICLSDYVPTGCEVAGCAAKANFSSSELLREAIIAMPSSTARENIAKFALELGLA